MNNTDDITVVAEAKNEKYTVSLIYRKKEQSFGFKISQRKRTYKFLPFLYKYKTFWVDMSFMGGTLQEDDYDFYDAFSKDIDRVIEIITYATDWYHLPEIPNLEELLFSTADDGRCRYVI